MRTRFYTAELLDVVGDGGSLVAVDVSPAMLALAERRCAGRPNVTFHLAGATALPVADAAFDRAVCVQVLEYVPDADAALAEIARALRPGGRAVVWDIDWATLSMHSADPERMRRTLQAWDLPPLRPVAAAHAGAAHGGGRVHRRDVDARTPSRRRRSALTRSGARCCG